MVENDEVEQELLNLLTLLDGSMDVLEHLTEENRPELISRTHGIIQSLDKLRQLEPKVTGSVPLELL